MLRVAHVCAPDSVPRLVHHDAEGFTIATEFLEGRETLTDAVCRGAVYPKLGRQLGSCLARLAAGTTVAALGPGPHAALAATLAASVSVSGAREVRRGVRAGRTAGDSCRTGSEWAAASGGPRASLHTSSMGAAAQFFPFPHEYTTLRPPSPLLNMYPPTCPPTCPSTLQEYSFYAPFDASDPSNKVPSFNFIAFFCGCRTSFSPPTALPPSEWQ